MPVSIKAEGEVYSPAGTHSACLVNRMPIVHLQLTAPKLFVCFVLLFACVFSLFTVVQLNTCDLLVRFQHVAVLFLRFLFPWLFSTRPLQLTIPAKHNHRSFQSGRRGGEKHTIQPMPMEICLSWPIHTVALDTPQSCTVVLLSLIHSHIMLSKSKFKTYVIKKNVSISVSLPRSDFLPRPGVTDLEMKLKLCTSELPTVMADWV